MYLVLKILKSETYLKLPVLFNIFVWDTLYFGIYLHNYSISLCGTPSILVYIYLHLFNIFMLDTHYIGIYIFTPIQYLYVGHPVYWNIYIYTPIQYLCIIYSNLEMEVFHIFFSPE